MKHPQSIAQNAFIDSEGAFRLLDTRPSKTPCGMTRFSNRDLACDAQMLGIKIPKSWAAKGDGIAPVRANLADDPSSDNNNKVQQLSP
jgi:hypothetical protein